MAKWSCSFYSVPIVLLGCSENFGNPAPPYEAPSAGRLLPGARLSQGIFGWPDSPFTENDFAVLALYRNVGDVAIDFELEDVDGQSHRLSTLLAEKPVLLAMGSHACTVYQDAVVKLNELANEAFDGQRTYADLVHFVHVYVVEAHPKAPDPAPHFGGVSEDIYSVVPQARTYGKRKENALLLLPALNDKQLLLLDDLRPHDFDNPIWSSYGSGAASAWFIRQDGTIVAAHDWIDMKTLKKAARLSLLAAQS
jgi:hypothetical protein